ncbi:hypothetical protein V8C43DRAFT_308700 [Trichoderma afarasin]
MPCTPKKKDPPAPDLSFVNINLCPIPGKLPRKLEMSDILVDIDDVYYTSAVRAVKAYWAQACLNKLKRYLIEQHNVTAMCFEYVNDRLTLVLREIIALRNDGAARAEDVDRLVKKVN